MTLADDLKAEGELLRRRMVHATRPKGLLSMSEALDLNRRMTGEEHKDFLREVDERYLEQRIRDSSKPRSHT